MKKSHFSLTYRETLFFSALRELTRNWNAGRTVWIVDAMISEIREYQLIALIICILSWFWFSFLPKKGSSKSRWLQFHRHVEAFSHAQRVEEAESVLFKCFLTLYIQLPMRIKPISIVISPFIDVYWSCTNATNYGQLLTVIDTYPIVRDMRVRIYIQYIAITIQICWLIDVYEHLSLIYCTPCNMFSEMTLLIPQIPRSLPVV